MKILTCLYSLACIRRQVIFLINPAANPDKLLTKFQRETGMIAKT
jgi:hypothetical protein